LLSVRTTPFSKRDGTAYGETVAPGVLLQGSSPSGSAVAGLTAYPVIAAASAAPPRKNALRFRSPFAATGSNFVIAASPASTLIPIF
jgi:hypothetical protein